MMNRLARALARTLARTPGRSLTAAFVLAIAPIAAGQAEPVSTETSIEDWTPEIIALPPGFAPAFPSGVESLRFPPGWRKPESRNFWSYAIVLWIDEPAPSNERLEALVDEYYTGLMDAFGVGRKADSPANDVDVELTEAADGHHRGSMRLVDGFATFEPLTVHVDVRTRAQSASRSMLAVRVSPQDHDLAIWGELQSAVDTMIKEQRIQRLAHLAGGEWRTGIANGSEQRDVWRWGPARQSLTSVTTNSKGTTEAVFGSFRVVYKHPRRDDLSVLVIGGPALSQTGRLLVTDDSTLLFDMTLFYDQQTLSWAGDSIRRISSVWSFDGPLRYTNTWVEDQGRPVEPGLVAWSYRRHDDVTPPPANASAHLERIAHFEALRSLLPSEWETGGTRTRFNWGRFHEAVVMRTTDKRTGAPIVETIFHAHPHTNVIHVLSLHASGAVDEGTLTTDGDAIVITATRSDHRGDTSIEQRIERQAERGTERPNAETLRIGVWSVDGAERTRLSETTHRAVGG